MGLMKDMKTVVGKTFVEKIDDIKNCVIDAKNVYLF